MTGAGADAHHGLDGHAITLFSGTHRLDGRLHECAGTPRGAMVVAHPHPLHGGNMDHTVVVTTAMRAARAGLQALRFDFRGVGASEGDRKDFDGHLEDWRQALGEMSRRTVDGPIYGAGFSYGARALAWLLHRDEDAPQPVGCLLLAPATRVPRTRRDFGNLLLGRPLTEATLDPHVLENLRSLQSATEVLVGSLDVVAPHEELQANLPPHARLTVLEDLNHFFSRGTGAGLLAEDAFVPAVDEAIARLMAAKTP